MDRILDAGFKQPADESVLIQSRPPGAGTPAFEAAVDDVVARVSRRAPPSQARPVAAGESRRTATPRSSSFDDPAATRTRRSTRSSPVLDAVARRAGGASAASRSASSATPAPSEGASTPLTANDLGKAGLFSLPITLIILVRRVRRARGRGHPAAARADRRLRDVRPDRAAEPPAPDRLRGARRWCC